MTDYDCVTFVARGVVALNAEVPDWRERLNAERLDVANVNDCVLGQVYSSFFSTAAIEFVRRHALANHEFHVERAATLGFAVPNYAYDTAYDLALLHKQLNEAWRAQLVTHVSTHEEN